MIKGVNSYSSSAKHLASLELSKIRRERFIELVLLGISLLSLTSLVIFLSANFMSTGYSVSLNASGGYIMNVNAHTKIPTNYWHGIYGLALRVINFTEQLYTDADSGELTRQDLFFECIQNGVLGGNEIYASTSPSIDFDNLQPANNTMIDSYIGCSGSVDCSSNTFMSNMSLLVGVNNISNVPSTNTYRWDGQNNVFDLGVLNDSENLVFVTHISSLQKGYNFDKIVNFQMLLPTPPNTTTRYYFFTDPNDECPEGGGVGETLTATISGYITDTDSVSVPNATAIIVGYSNNSDSTGFYNISFTVIPGDYHLLVLKSGYDTYFSNVSVNFTNYIIHKNVTLEDYTPGTSVIVTPTISGYVRDSSSNLISGVNISIGSGWDYTNSTGYYSITHDLIAENQPIIALKEGYDNYREVLSINSSTTNISHNITMSIASAFDFPTGPYPNAPNPPGYPEPPKKSKEGGEDFWISTKGLDIEVRENTFVRETVGLYNFLSSSTTANFVLSDDLKGFVRLNTNSLTILGKDYGNLILTVYGSKPVGEYYGNLSISGGISSVIPIKVRVLERKVPVETLLMDLKLLQDRAHPGENVVYRINLQNLITDQKYRVRLRTFLVNNGTEIPVGNEENVEISNALSLIESFKVPDIDSGEYLLRLEAEYLNLFSRIETPIMISTPLHLYSFFGIPLWVIMSLVSFIGFLSINFFFYRRYKERKKRYRIKMDFSSLPQHNPRSLNLGLIAESKVPAYLDMERLTTHTIVAGATGMGKSISAQVLVEEALMKNIAVIVFDPTAQWSGMLRKCTDKNMFAYYPKFGLKESDSRAFVGNIRQVKNAREIIDINHFMTPGQIQIFALNKLDPADIDIFAANVIRQIFRGGPKESAELKVLLVFDEVHRLLPKFGGSGAGFLQIERAAREFRKWGMGLLLISQVLSDFVGEIKANINTEIQTRTVEENDLERVKTKYGEEFLKSLVRAEVGTAMFQNAEYNRGSPYFIGFRPILHNTRRLGDDELEKYNHYNEIIDDLEFQVQQLDELKRDVFDYKIELKLVKDKVMNGNFAVVDIYLEGLIPRIDKEWKTINKKPKKKELVLASEAEIKASIEEAKKARETAEKNKTP